MMKTIINIAFIFVFSISYAGVEGTVTATTLNVRVKPGTKYAVVSQLKKGEKVEVIDQAQGWYEIKAPADTKVYVASSYVEDGRVVKEVHLRAGPSVAFSSFKTVLPGEQLQIIDKSRKDWLQVKAPLGLTAWTSAEYVFLTPEMAAKLTGRKPEQKVGKKPEEITATESKESLKKGKDPLPYTENKGKLVSVEGYLVKLSKDSVHVTHAVASRIKGEYFPLCYVHSTKQNLKLWEGKRVNVTGIQRWVKNWQRPVVEVEKIKAAW